MTKQYNRPVPTNTRKHFKTPDDHDYREHKKFAVQVEEVFNAIPKRASITITGLKKKGIEDRDLWTILRKLQTDERITFNEEAANITRFSRGAQEVHVKNLEFGIQIRSKSIYPRY